MSGSRARAENLLDKMTDSIQEIEGTEDAKVCVFRDCDFHVDSTGEVDPGGQFYPVTFEEIRDAADDDDEYEELVNCLSQFIY